MIFVRWTETDDVTGVRRERKGWVEQFLMNAHGNPAVMVLVDGIAIRQVDVAQLTFLCDTRAVKRQRHMERWMRDGSSE